MIVQSDSFPPEHASVIVCQMTAHLAEADFRLTVEPRAENGLRERSQIMIDKPITVRRSTVGETIGLLSTQEISKLNGMLAFVMGLGD